MAFADTAMVIANLAANRGYRPMTTVDQTTHFMRAVTASDVLADARVVRLGRTMSFGRVTLLSRHRQQAGGDGLERVRDAAGLVLPESYLPRIASAALTMLMRRVLPAIGPELLGVLDEHVGVDDRLVGIALVPAVHPGQHHLDLSSPPSRNCLQVIVERSSTTALAGVDDATRKASGQQRKGRNRSLHH